MIQRLTIVNAAGLALLWLAESIVGERFWLTSIAAHIPQFLFAWPITTLLLGVALARRRFRLAAANGLVLIGATLTMTGLTFHRPIPTRDTRSVRVMTFNIEHGSAGFDAVAAAIRQQNPDVVCLQESSAWAALDDPPADLRRRLLPDYHGVLTSEASLITRLPIVETRRILLPPAPDSRAAAVAVLDAGNGRRVTVVSAHLLAPNWQWARWRAIPSDLNRTNRAVAAQIDALRHGIEALPGPVIVCGDFNLPPSGRHYRRLREKLDDGFASAGNGFGWTIPADQPIQRFDYVFLRRESDPAIVSRIFVPDVRASDHRPVVADLRVP